MPALLPRPDRALLPPLGRPVLDLPLARAAAAYGALAVLLVLAGFADGRTVLGEGVWLKPARFAVSIVLPTSRVVYTCKGRGVEARGEYVDDGMLVLAGSSWS